MHLERHELRVRPPDRVHRPILVAARVHETGKVDILGHEAPGASAPGASALAAALRLDFGLHSWYKYPFSLGLVVQPG